MGIDFLTRERHFLDHLAPVWQAIPPRYRGTFYASSDEARARARALGLEVTPGAPSRDKRAGPIVVASSGDLVTASRCRRQVIYCEHGAGQSYGNRHTSYAGGRGRDTVALFLVPNAYAGDRNRRYYPGARIEVVGCPKLDNLKEISTPAGAPTVAISFHWRCTVQPETGSALDDFAPELDATRRRLEEAGVELIGHAHPRILNEAREVFELAGIEVVDNFETVVERAHAYAVDNSSTLFEFAALGRPVIVLNARAYRRDVDFGLRFWKEASVGIQADPGELADRLLEALADPPAVARSRSESIERVYPFADGSSSSRAAEAIVSLIRGKCPVCGVAACACGPATTVIPIDERIRDRERMSGLKKYPNPAKAGAFLRLNDADAKRLGLLGTDVGSVSSSTPRPVDDVVNELGSRAQSAQEPPESPPPAPRHEEGSESEEGDPVPVSGASSEFPAGAIAPGGPTARARRAAASAPEEEQEEPGDETAPGHKKRPAPTSRRRRKTPSAPS